MICEKFQVVEGFLANCGSLRSFVLDQSTFLAFEKQYLSDVSEIAEQVVYHLHINEGVVQTANVKHLRDLAPYH